MLTRRFWLPVFGLALILALSALACSMPSVGPTAPCTVTTSDEAAQRLLDRIKEASKQTGESVSIEMSNEELSSVLDASLKQAAKENGNTSLNITNTTVCFTGGKMKIFGSVKSEESSSTVDVLMSITVTAADGALSATIDELQLGPVPVPEDVRKDMSKSITESLNDSFDTIDVTDIKVEDGKMTVTGDIK